MKNFSIFCSILILSIFVLLGTSCSASSNSTQDTPYPHNANEIDKQKWIEEKIEYLEKNYKQKILLVEEDDEFIIFTFETEYMTPNWQIKKVSYSK